MGIGIDAERRESETGANYSLDASRLHTVTKGKRINAIDLANMGHPESVRSAQI